jgi:uncharacterized protein (DUF697 family)
MSTAATIDNTAATETTEQAPCAKSMEMDGRKAYTADLIKKHALGAAGIGLIPMPGVDFVALTALQVNLLRKLSDFYGVAFTEEIGKKVVGALAGGYAPVALALPVASMLKAIPVIGMTTGILAMSAVAGASTYAVGKVFVQHFESGGTFLNFDPAAVREYYREQFKEGSSVVKNASE